MQEGTMHDTVIRGGTIIDGTGGAAFSGDVAIEGGRLAQVIPVKASTVTGRSFTELLKFFGGHGKLTYTQSPGAQLLSVSSSGKLTAPDTLAAGTYEVFGTVKDAVGDTGTWTFTLTVEGF